MTQPTPLHAPAPIDLSHQLLAFAAEASTADALPLAVKLARLAANHHPTRETLTRLADYVAASGDAEEVIRIYRRMLDEFGIPHDAQIARALALAEAEIGDFKQALHYLWRVVALGAETDELWFYIGTCYAMDRQFAAANQIFSRNFMLPLHGGMLTSTGLLRLPERREAIRKVAITTLPFKREFSLDRDIVAHDERVLGVDLIHLICCDSRYLGLFARQVARSVAERSAVNAGLHFHVVNITPDDRRLVQQLRETLDLPIVCSTETVDFGDLKPDQIKTYLSCVRFLLLPELQARYQKTILVTDADQTVLRPLDQFIARARQHDAALMLFRRARYNLLALITASVCVASVTEKSQQFFRAVRDYILERMTDPAGMAWHLDQAALAAVYLASEDIDFHLIPPAAMISTILKAASPEQEEALFWSATYSVNTNARKLDSEQFQSL